MTISLADLPKGHEFAQTRLELTPEWVDEYRAATEDGAGGPRVPPLALATLCLRELLGQTSLPEGAIHVGQELSFSLADGPVGTLVAKARIATRGERQGWVLMGMEMAVEDAVRTLLVSGRATITFPAGGDAREPSA